MTQVTTVERPAPQSQATGRHQRSVRNYLLDAHFQLKYTAMLVVIALGVSVPLGVMLWRASREVISQSEQTVTQGNLSVEHGREAIKQSRTASEVVANYIAEKYAQEPILAAQFAEDAKKDDEMLAARLAQIERVAGELAHRSEMLAAQQQRVLVGLVAALGLLVVLLGVAGIVFTHRVAGPIFKMKRLLREIGKGKLILRERLRKGDELHHFFATFEEMVEDLRASQKREIARLDAVIARVEAAGVDVQPTAEALADLRALRAEMLAQLEA